MRDFPAWLQRSLRESLAVSVRVYAKGVCT